MTEAKDDGGAAFPGEALVGSFHNQGMSLRDYFAGHALAGLLANDYPANIYTAALAYEMADNMLEARNAQTP